MALPISLVHRRQLAAMPESLRQMQAQHQEQIDAVEKTIGRSAGAHRAQLPPPDLAPEAPYVPRGIPADNLRQVPRVHGHILRSL
jgi:hypothetical protein